MRATCKMTGVILVGGKSRRMGQEKARMTVGGVQVFRRILGVFETLFNEILIVTDKKGRFTEYGYPEVADIIPDCGPMGGIYTGLYVAKSDSIFVASCDLPFIHTSIVKFLIKESNAYDIVVPDIDGRLHPLHATYSKRCIPFIRKQIEDGSFNLTRFINEVQGLSVRRVGLQELVSDDPELRSVFNMNTQEDWIEANKVVGT